MRKAFGDDENIGLIFRNINEFQEVPRDKPSSKNLKALTNFYTHQPNTESSISLNTAGLQAIGRGVDLYDTQKKLEFISCILSIFCLFASAGVWIVQNSITIQLTRNTQFRSQDPDFLNSMKLWHNTVAESCASGSFELIMTQPPWKNSQDQQYNGLAIDGVIHASYINLTAVVFFIYIFSATFQGKRYMNLRYEKIENGPDFSRWFEYALTSPLQIVLVAISFGISNIDIILGFFGMQVALVLIGYSIEKQIKKKYLRKKSEDESKFHYFKNFGDIRGLVYILVSWTLHFLIWGAPGLWEQNIVVWGISGQYANILQYQNKCGDRNFEMPAFVNVIFFGQFICFTLFGVVCTIQYVTAGYLGEDSDSKETIKDSDLYRSKWARFSFWYAFLSVSAKTILEVGFLGLVITSPEYLKQQPVSKAIVTRLNATRLNTTHEQLLHNNTFLFPAHTTCYTIDTK